MARWLALVALCVVAGCGSSKSPDQDAVADVAQRYIDAVGDKDWDTVCKTRVESERQEFARLAGSCPEMFDRIFENQPTDQLDGAEIGDVRIEGDKAGADVRQDGKKVSTIAAVREDGHWLLKDLEDSETP